MATLSDVAAEIADELSRSDLSSQIKLQIGYAVQRLNREVSHITEMRALTFNTAAGTVWYSTVDATGGEGYGAAQGASMSVKNIISVDYIRQSPAGENEPLLFMKYDEFEAMREGSTASGDPKYWTLYGGRIGLHPTPNAVQAIEITANVKPVVPSDDADTSVWFDEAQELVQAMAASRVCLKYLKDAEQAQIFNAIAQGERQALGWETVKKRGTGRIRAHD